MKSGLGISSGLLMCLCVGCSETPKSQLVDDTNKFNAWAEVLKTVADRASYDKAKPDLLKYQDFYNERKKRPKKSEQEKAELKAMPEWKAFRESLKSYTHEWARVTSLPEVGELYQKEVMGTEPSKSDPDE